jgi:CHAT domain-containing protein
LSACYDLEQSEKLKLQGGDIVLESLTGVLVWFVGVIALVACIALINLLVRFLRRRAQGEKQMEAFVPEKAIRAAKAFLAAGTWDDAFAMLEREQDLLLNSHVDQFLSTWLTETQRQLEQRGNTDLPLRREAFYLEVNREVLRSARSFPLAALKAQCEKGLPSETRPFYLSPSIHRVCIAFANASWEEKHTLLEEEQAFLLKPAVDNLFSSLLVRQRHLDWEPSRLLLRRSREVGIPAAWREFEAAYPVGKRPEVIKRLVSVETVVRPHPLMLIIRQLVEDPGKEEQENRPVNVQAHLIDQALEAFLCSSLWHEKQSVVAQKRDWLLTEEAKQRLRRFIEQARKQKLPELLLYLDLHDCLLQRLCETDSETAWSELEEEHRKAQIEPPGEIAFHDFLLDPLFRELKEIAGQEGRQRQIELLRQLITGVESGLGDELTKAMLYYALAEMRPGETLSERCEEALHCYQQTLSVYTPERFPHKHAQVQAESGILYWLRLKGSRGDNIEAAISCYREIIRTVPLLSDDAHSPHVSLLSDKVLSPLNNLGMLLIERTRGKPVENLKQAIICLNIQLFLAGPAYSTVGTKLNLGRAYSELAELNDSDWPPEGEFERAIACYREALADLPRESSLQERIMVLTNLGSIYLSRSQRSPVDDVEQAIACFEEGLEICQHGDFPAQHAGLLQSLARAYIQRVSGARAQNLQASARYLEQATQVWPVELYPRQYMSAHTGRAYLAFSHLAVEAEQRNDQDAAYKAYVMAAESFAVAAQIQSQLGWQEMDEEGRSTLLGAEYLREMYANYAWSLWKMGDIKQAVVALETGKAQALSEALLIENWLLKAICPEHGAAFKQAEQKLRQVRAKQAEQKPSQMRATNDPTDIRQAHDSFLEIRRARDHFLEVRQMILACPICCEADIFSSEPTYKQVAQAASSDQAIIYLAATSRGGIALLVPPAQGFNEGEEQEPIAISLPDLTSERVRSWLFSADGDGNPARGFYIPINDLSEKFLDQWNNSSGRTGQSLQMTVSLQNSADFLPETMITVRQALRELVQKWTRDAEQGSTGRPEQQENAQKLRELLQRPFGESLMTGTIKKDLNWYLQKAELDYVLPELSKVIMAPLREMLNRLRLQAPVQRVALIPCGSLSMLPLHAAFVLHPQTGRLVPFQETCECTYQPGARVLARTRARADALPKDGPVITVGNTRPTGTMNLRFAEVEARINAAQGRSKQRPASNALLGNPANNALLGNDATFQAVKEALLKSKADHDGSWIEFAAHGCADPLNPHNCYMLLAGDERLTLSRLRQEQLLTGVRCFSAVGCVTGKIDLFAPPDELISFATGILQAGAASATATLWPVSDKASCYLMIRFYQMVLENPEQSPAWAMREATSWLRTATRSDLDAVNRKYNIVRLALSSSTQRRGEDTDALLDMLRGSAVLEQMEQRGTSSVSHQDDFVASSHCEETIPYAHPVHWAATIVYGA